MPKTTKSKKTTVTRGSGGINTKKSKLNLKLVIPIVLVVAALGGFYIFQKSSASSASELSGGGEMKKGDGLTYQIDDNGRVSSAPLKPLVGRSNVCARVMRITYGSTYLSVRIYDSMGKQLSNPGESSGYLSGGAKSELCGVITPQVKDKAAYYSAVVSGEKGFGVNAIYSK